MSLSSNPRIVSSCVLRRNGSNYLAWRAKMKRCLEARGLFYTVCEPKSVDGSVESIKVETSVEAKSDKSRQEDSATTLHLLFESLEDDLAADMDSEDITTALDLWKKLSERFEKLLVPNIRAKYAELMTMKLNSGGDMAEYLQKRADLCTTEGIWGVCQRISHDCFDIGWVASGVHRSKKSFGRDPGPHVCDTQDSPIE